MVVSVLSLWDDIIQVARSSIKVMFCGSDVVRNNSQFAVVTHFGLGFERGLSNVIQIWQWSLPVCHPRLSIRAMVDSLSR